MSKEETVKISKDIIDGMREILETQGNDGNWNYDEYMFGLYNGMEFMVAMIEGREPVFRDKPKEFLENKVVHSEPVVFKC